MHDENDIPLSEEERRLAKIGEELIASAVADTQAPQSLREAIERERERAQAAARAPFWRRHLRSLAAATAVIAALAGVVIGVTSGSRESAPSLAAVQVVAQANATEPAPAPEGGSPPTLAARVAPISFPDWRKSFGWRAVGRREDELSGRMVRTVFYRNGEGARLGYSIVAGDPLSEQPPGREVTRSGNAYHVARADGQTIVTWVQQGHTCTIVGASSVPASRLVELAASRNPAPA